MKTTIAFTFFIVGITCLPQAKKYPVSFSNQRDIVSGTIVKAIEAASQSIRDAGLDPLYIEKKEFSYALPVPVIFNTAAVIEELLSSGLSYIVVRRMNYDVTTSRLSFEVELPLIHFSIESATAVATLFGNKLDVEASGRIDVRSIRISGQIRINISVLTGISIRNININFSLGGINAETNVVIQNANYSDNVNTFLNTTIPTTLTEFSAEINELLEIILLNVINSNLNKV